MPLSVGTPKQYSGGASSTTLAVAITAVSTELTVVDGSGLPDPTGTIPADPNDPVPSGALPFVITVDRGTPSEEKILISGRTLNNLTVQDRGFDGTVATSHGEQAVVEHTIDAESFSRFEAHVGNPGETDVHNIDQIEGLQTKVDALDAHVDAGSTTAHTISNINGLQAALNLKATEVDLTTAEGRITVNEGEIDTLQTDVLAAEGDITTLQGDVTTLQGDVNDVELEINNGLGLRETVVFASSGTFTKASYPWLRKVRVRAVGGGGGGGGVVGTSAGEHAVAAGGGAGGYFEALYDAADLAASESVTIGGGGVGGSTAGSDGANGGDTVFKGGTAEGGFGGNGDPVANPGTTRWVYEGSGGSTTVIDPQVYHTQEGQTGSRASGQAGFPWLLGDGGASAFGAADRSWTNSYQGSQGRSATNPGAGGSGGFSCAGGGAQLGGFGADGIVILELYA